MPRWKQLGMSLCSRKLPTTWNYLRCHIVGVYLYCGWLNSQVVNMLDSGAEGHGFRLQLRRCQVTFYTHRASVHQAAKLVAALLRVARVTAGLAESNGSLPPGLWLASPTGWLPKTGISSGTLCSVIELGYLYLLLVLSLDVIFVLCW